MKALLCVAVWLFAALLLAAGCLQGCAKFSTFTERDVLPTTVETCNLEVAKAELAISKLNEVQADFLNAVANDSEDKIPEKVEKAFLNGLEDELQYLSDRIVRINAIKSTLAQ